MKDKKYKGIINIYTSIIFDYKNAEIEYVVMEELTRPVLRVKDGKAMITKDTSEKLSKMNIHGMIYLYLPFFLNQL